MNRVDPEDIIALQVETQLREALMNQGEDQDSYDSSNRVHRKTIEKKIRDEMYNNKGIRASPQQKLVPGSGQRLFPIFGDFGLSVFSINYALYFEFSKIIMRMLFQLLFFGIVLNILDWFLRYCAFPEMFLQEEDIIEYCSTVADQIDQWTCQMDKRLIVECKQYLVGAFYCVFAALFALRFQTSSRQKEEARIINNPMLYDFNWTQDFFSVLIENIPKNATEDELRAFFNNQEALKKIQGEVKEIVFVQDISKCAQILQKINHLEKVDAQQPDHEKDLQDLKNKLYQEESKLPLHNGKAIVVFDSLRTRSVILQLFPHSKINLLESFIRGYKAKTAFKNSYLTSNKLPEPQNLNFENLCYPKSKKFCRQITAFALSMVLIVLTTLAALRFEVYPALNKFENKEALLWNKKFIDTLTQIVDIATNSATDDTTNDAEDDIATSEPFDIFEKLQSYSLPIVLIVIQALQDIAFQVVEKITKRISKIHSEQSWLNYSIYSSFFLYLVVQGLIMLFQWEDAANIAHKTIYLFCMKHLARKFGGLFFCYRKVNYPEFNDCKGIYYSIRNGISLYLFGIDMTSKTFQFRFFKEASKVFPLVAMNFAFMANGSNVITNLANVFPLTFPITIITLYIGAFCDKYCLINQPEQSKFNSARFMIKLFRFFKADHFAFLFGAIIWMGSFAYYAYEFSVVLPIFFPSDKKMKNALKEEADDIFAIPVTVVVLIISIYLLYLAVRSPPESLEAKYDFYFEQHRSLVPYDLVSSHFTDTYKNPLTSNHVSREEIDSLIL